MPPKLLKKPKRKVEIEAEDIISDLGRMFILNNVDKLPLKDERIHQTKAVNL